MFLEFRGPYYVLTLAWSWGHGDKPTYYLGLKEFTV